MSKKIRKNSYEEKIIQVATLATQGFALDEISEATNLSLSSVVTYLSTARKKGLLSNCIAHRKSFAKTRKLTVHINDKLIQEFVHNHPDIFDINRLPKSISLDQIEKIVKSICYPQSDVNILVRLYTNKGLFEEAVNTLYLYQEYNDLTSEEIKKVEILRHQLRINEAKQFFGRIPNTLIGNYYDER